MNEMKKSLMIPKLLREAPVVESSVGEGNRSVRIAWATDRPVRRPGYFIDVPGVDEFYEVLSMDPAHIRLERFLKGLSVLDSHNWMSCDSVVGVATGPIFPEGKKESHCTVAFSPNHEKAERIAKDVAAGILRHWSFGYDVHKFQRMGEAEDGIPIFLAIDWEPTEISVVPVPADPDAGLRAQDSKHLCVVSWREKEMADEDDEEDKKNKSEEEEDEENKKKGKGKKDESEDEEDEDKGKKSATVSAEERKNIAVAERGRIREIRSAARVFGTVVDEADIDSFIESGASADDVRRELIKRAEAKQVKVTPFSQIEVGREPVEKKRELMSKAILNRANPQQYRLRGERGGGERDPALEFRGMTLLDMAKVCLEDAGVNWRGYSPREIAAAAMNQIVRDKHATTDFPILMAATIRDVLRDSYNLASQTYQPFCRRASVKDFKEKNLIQIGDVSAFKEVLEGGEYPRATFGEAKESYRVKKYGQIIALTWEAIVNDELDAFSRLPMSVAMEAAQLCSDIVYDILNTNPVMGDGKALFHADHGNLGTAADIDLTGMDAAFTAIGTQKNLAKRQLNLTPEFLIFGHNKRTKALQYLNDTVVATKPADVTPSQMRSLTPIVEGRVPGTKWFLACQPGVIDTIEYAYLEGEEGLFTEERWGFEVDGLEMKARLVFGAKAIDWRGLYMNPGKA